MTVDFEIKRSPTYQVASLAWTGTWSEKALQSKFSEVERWAKDKGLRTGSYFFYEREARQAGKEAWRFEACIEVKGKARGSDGVRVKTLPAGKVASVTFNPEELSPRVVYHGLSDWIRWRKKDGEVKGTKGPREVYLGNPWANQKAWSKVEVQFILR